MSFKNDGLQVEHYVYDFAVDGGAVSTIDLSAKAGKSPLPVGAVVQSVLAWVETAVTSNGSATCEWGNSDTDGYSGTAIAKATLVANYVHGHAMGAAALLWDNTNDNDVPYYVSSAATGAFNFTINVAALTAGKIHFEVVYSLMA